jgi:2-oxoglutarate ferredoxin oxidoreductase subunit alpha
MNDWVVPQLEWDDGYIPDRGRVLTPEDLDHTALFSRYADEDEDSVTPRTLPGVDARGAYFTRGSGHNKFGAYTEIPDEYQEVVDRLARKHRAAARYVPPPVIEYRDSARVGVVTVGGCDLAVREALNALEERGVMADYMRIRGFPFSSEIQTFLDDHEVLFVVEQNRDAQLRSLLVLETCVPKEKLRSVLVYGGFPLSARPVVEGISAQLER